MKGQVGTSTTFLRLKNRKPRKKLSRKELKTRAKYAAVWFK